ncbi:MAG: hypothetical protein AABZ12_07950 [Planctomycetota bacterium]
MSDSLPPLMVGDPAIEIPCPRCDYDLRSAVAERCPECGWKIDPQELLADLQDRRLPRRIIVACSGLVLGAGSVLSVLALCRRRQLALADGILSLGVLLAAAGHFALVASATLQRGRWPMRADAARDILRLVGGLSIALAIVGAAAFLRPSSQPQLIRGVVVSHALEFIGTAAIFSLPAIALLLLQRLSFRSAVARKPRSPHTSILATPSLPTGASFSVSFAQRYTSEQIVQRWTDDPRPTNPAAEAMIAAAWETQLALAEQENRRLYDGRLVRLVQLQAEPSRLHLRLGPTSFRDFLGTNLFNAAAVLRQNARSLADAVGVSTIVRTADHAIALGRRGPSVAYHAGFLHAFGGMLDETDRRADGTYDLFGAAQRELVEELGLQRGEVHDLSLIAVVRDLAIQQPEFVFEANVALSCKEIEARFRPGEPGQEHTGIEFAFGDPSSILPFLRRVAPVAPTAEAAVLLHGLFEWGREWYEQTCLVLYGEIPRT